MASVDTAQLPHSARPAAVKDKFFLIAALLMALVLVAGFSIQLAFGRSSFSAPLYVHMHGVLFFAWTAFYVMQNALAVMGGLALHRRTGWLAVILMPAMTVIGLYTIVTGVQLGRVPFFFQPLSFLALDALTILGFVGLTTAGILMRRRTQWHRRLIFCGTALLLGPGFGRILPMPLFIPWAEWAVFAAILIFPIAGVIYDLLRDGRAHPAWWWGIGAMFVVQIAIPIVTYSPFGLWLYETVTQGTPGAALAPLAFPPPPGP